MRFFQYALLACLIACLIADEDEGEHEQENEDAGLGETPAEPTNGPTELPKTTPKPTEESNSVDQNTGGKGGGESKAGASSPPALSQKEKKQRMKLLRIRCSFNPDKGNCVGSRSRSMWWYDPNDNLCKSFKTGYCRANIRPFLSCRVCMNTCMRNRNRTERARLTKKVCLTKV
uniref:Pancreatic trypsin inhibitor n=1 Tax=Rhipicephalus zambeziensis TaxID=60191 RepID=A0A224Y8D4_9ACAR